MRPTDRLCSSGTVLAALRRATTGAACPRLQRQQQVSPLLSNNPVRTSHPAEGAHVTYTSCCPSAIILRQHSACLSRSLTDKCCLLDAGKSHAADREAGFLIITWPGSEG